MTDNAMIVSSSGAALARYGDREDVRELADRLLKMHPAAAEVGSDAMRAAAQLALLLGANPLPGVNEMHIWRDNKGRNCMSLGINFWRRMAAEWGGVLYEMRPRLMRPDEAAEYGVPQGTTAAICKGARAADMIRYRQLGFTTNEVWDMCGRTGVGTTTANEYAKQGRPPSWTALKRAETDMLRQLFPAEFGSVDREMVGSEAPAAIVVGVDVIDGDVIDGDVIDGDAEEQPRHRYTLAHANADLFGSDDPEPKKDRPVTVTQDGEIVDEPPAPPTNGKATPALDPIAMFVARAEKQPGVQAAEFANGRLAAWVNYVTGDKFDPAHADYLNEVLDRYCSAVADNGNTHTKAAAEKARADYRQGLAALAQPAAQDGLFGNDDPDGQSGLAASQPALVAVDAAQPGREYQD